MTQRPTACLLVIGDEILTGRTQDVHIQYLGKKLSVQGIDLKEARVISDDIESIVKHVNDVRASFTYVFTTGGIGPTHDDKTAKAIAKAFNLPLEENEEALAMLQARWGKGELSPANRRMARIPKGANLIENIVTQAPGFQVDNVYVLAGVPSIMRAMVDTILPNLKGGTPLKSKSISCLLGEGTLAETLENLELKNPAVQIGSYPFFSPEGHGTTIVIRGTQAEEIEKVFSLLEEYIRDKEQIPEIDPINIF